MIDLNNLIALTQGIDLSTESTSPFWNDPHISKSLLEAHLDPDTDAASRRPAAIQATIDWLLSSVLPAQAKVLDLGCGPGLYAEALARADHTVTGLDFSERSIRYARESAEKNGLDIRYIQGSYLETDLETLTEEGSEDGFEGGFDAVIMIYCDLGALKPEARSLLMTKVLACLKSGGIFVFDLFGQELFDSTKEGRAWDLATSGFWSDKPYLYLEETRKYPEEPALLRVNLVAREDGVVDRIIFRDYCFDKEEIKALATSAGFSSCTVVEDILPPSNWDGGKPRFAVARKQEKY